jgi:glycosyltransferase involved in cell wall biosynthesis
MRIAVFDYQVISINAIGSYNLKIIESLLDEHDFTVFAVNFENPAPDRVKWVRIWVPRRPLALLFVAYHLVAPICYLIHRMTTRYRYDVIQKVESNLLLGDVCFTHFCHRAFLRNHWRQVSRHDLRSWFRWLDHWLHALLEGAVYARAQAVVVPSHGMERELTSEFNLAGKTTIIANPVDVASYKRPEGFDRPAARGELGIEADDTVLVFIALGHFERKGLPLVLDAMSLMNEAKLRLVVVGGEPDLVTNYEKLCRNRGLESAVRFTGNVNDVRPYLWLADAFIFPSAYEAFSMVSCQAAAAGITPIMSRLYGVAEGLIDGQSSIIVDRTTESVRTGIERFMKLPTDQKKTMGLMAQAAVQGFDEGRFIASCRDFYARLQAAARSSQSAQT